MLKNAVRLRHFASRCRESAHGVDNSNKHTSYIIKTSSVKLSVFALPWWGGAACFYTFIGQTCDYQIFTFCKCALHSLLLSTLTSFNSGDSWKELGSNKCSLPQKRRLAKKMRMTIFPYYITICLFRNEPFELWNGRTQRPGFIIVHKSLLSCF